MPSTSSSMYSTLGHPLTTPPPPPPPCCFFISHGVTPACRVGYWLACTMNKLFSFPSPTAAEGILASRSSLRPHTHPHTAHMLSLARSQPLLFCSNTYIHIEYIRESRCACCRPPAVLSRCSAHSSTLFSFAFLSP